MDNVAVKKGRSFNSFEIELCIKQFVHFLTSSLKIH